jgi:hypothetical protein
MRKVSNSKTLGRYLGRVFKSTSKASHGTIDILSATVVYVDESGVEHATGYDHPRVRSPRSEDWEIRKLIFQNFAEEIGQIARDFQGYLKETGSRFELAHPSWWAPGVDEQPPYWSDEDASDDLLAA